MREDIGRLVLRIAIGGLLLLHGMFKLLNGIDGIKGAVTTHGIPEFAAYGVYLGEIVGPILVILGLFARIGGALIVIDILVAIGLARLADVAALNQYGGYRLELEALFLFGGLAIALLGAGRLSVGGGRFN
jgi:putative oxidoreductase